MKATIVSPRVWVQDPKNHTQGTRIGLCIVIPFDKLELSIAIDNGPAGVSAWCNREDCRVYVQASGQDITKKVLGQEANSAYDGYDLMKIMDLVKRAEAKMNNTEAIW